MAMRQDKIDKISAQAIQEIQAARIFKQGKISNWQKNEDLYYARKIRSVESRANVQLARMQEFVHTLLSKIDNPLTFKFIKRKNSQLKRVALLNALKEADQNSNDWDMKDIVGKKQAIIYGRTIYCYYADSKYGNYKPNLWNIDVYDFLIDPSCGGINIEEARHLGDYSVIFSKKDLKEGKKSGLFLRDQVNELIDGSGNADDMNQEQTNKRSRTYDQNTIGWKENSDPDKYRFWRWFTTFADDGERYYLLMDNSGRTIRCELLSDVFAPTASFPNAPWPYWTWAAFPDLTEFWTPSYADYAREIFMAQDVSINQMLDNAEAINKPQKVVNVGAIEDMAQLKYRRDGIIKTKGDYDVNKAIQIIQTPSINTPIEVFNILEAINEKSSGVTAGAKGVADEGGKVGIYEGNQEATADRFGLLNKSYAFGYKRFARLYELGVRDNLVKKTAIEIVGPDGIEIVEAKHSDIFLRDDEFSVMIEASNAEFLASNQDKQSKLAFLQAQAINQGINQKKSFEMQAKIVGFNSDEINELQDVSFYGNSELMSEADRDIERLLNNEKAQPNQAANNAYKQKLVTWMQDHIEDMTNSQFARMQQYILDLEPIIMKNEARTLQNEQTQAMLRGGKQVDETKLVTNEAAQVTPEPVTP